MALRTPHPRSSETADLIQFCNLCDEIEACRFFREFPQRAGPITCGTLPDGRVVDVRPHYDLDDLRSFATLLRQLLAKSNRTFLLSVINKLQRDAGERERAALNDARRDVLEEANSWWGVTIRDDTGADRLLSASDVTDALFNGHVFHRDPSQRWDEVRKYQAFWEHSFVRYATTVVQSACRVREMIRLRQNTLAGSPAPISDSVIKSAASS